MKRSPVTDAEAFLKCKCFNCIPFHAEMKKFKSKYIEKRRLNVLPVYRKDSTALVKRKGNRSTSRKAESRDWEGLFAAF